MSAYVLIMLFWAFIYYGMININFINPAPEGVPDYRREGSSFGVLLVLFFSAILLLITLINLNFQNGKYFYVKFFVLILISNLLLCGIGFDL